MGPSGPLLIHAPGCTWQQGAQASALPYYVRCRHAVITQALHAPLTSQPPQRSTPHLAVARAPGPGATGVGAVAQGAAVIGRVDSSFDGHVARLEVGARLNGAAACSVTQ